MKIAFMKRYCGHTLHENDKIHKQLVELINELGGEIDVSDMYKDRVWAILFDSGTQAYKEFNVTKIRANNGYLEVYVPDYYYDGYEYYFEDYTEEDLWFSVIGDAAANVTLYNICAVLEEYIND